MAELAIIGDNEFVMGFLLIGIKKIFEGNTGDELKKIFTEAMADISIGIIVTDDKSLQKLSLNFRRQVENSITPVVVVLSLSSYAQDNIRDMIKKAIGVDLMAK